MHTIQAVELPAGALLHQYKNERTFADCYCTGVPEQVSVQQLTHAFYTTRLFKLERTLIGALLHKRSTDSQARQLAQGQLDRFAAWSVERRAPDQILLADQSGATRSWLMTQSLPDSAGTRLYFGSAVIARRMDANGKPRFSVVFHALLGFHRAYSRALLNAAVRQLKMNA